MSPSAHDVNNYGQVVGRVVDPTIDVAFIWDSGNGIRDLNTLIDPSLGWHLTEANAINDNGQIVGWGEHNGQTRAFLLTP